MKFVKTFTQCNVQKSKREKEAGAAAAEKLDGGHEN